jgi:hypothetical protein
MGLIQHGGQYRHRFLSVSVSVSVLVLGACGSEPAAAPGADAVDDGSLPAAGSAAGAGGSGQSEGSLPNLSTAGSGGSSGSTASGVDCGFAALDDCVDAAVVEALGCLQADRTGVFATDRLSCSFPDASGEVQFDERFPTGANGFPLSLRLLVDGQECVSYRDAVVTPDAPSPLELRTQHHFVRFMPGRERMLECDGVSQLFLTQDIAACVPGGMQSPELSKDVLLGNADVFFYRVGMDYLFRCSKAPE